jgi:hypothetical protein
MNPHQPRFNCPIKCAEVRDEGREHPFICSSPNTFSMSLVHVSARSTGVIKSRAFATISSLLIGSSGVPRTVSLRSLRCVPPASVTSTTATRYGNKRAAHDKARTQDPAILRKRA